MIEPGRTWAVLGHIIKTDQHIAGFRGACYEINIDLITKNDSESTKLNDTTSPVVL